MENEDAAVLSLEKHLGCAMSGTTANLDCAANRAAPLFGDGHPTDTEQTVPQFTGSMQEVKGHITFFFTVLLSFCILFLLEVGDTVKKIRIIIQKMKDTYLGNTNMQPIVMPDVMPE